MTASTFGLQVWNWRLLAGIVARERETLMNTHNCYRCGTKVDLGAANFDGARRCDECLHLYCEGCAGDMEDGNCMLCLGKEQEQDESEVDEDAPEYCEPDDEFADPTGHSALRRATKVNPRNIACPTCKQPNRLTPKDKSLHYQCDQCSDKAEAGVDGY